jgi:hypothetical protein
MSADHRHPSRLAIWLVERFGPRLDANALTGDLIEQSHAGRSSLWLWKEALLAIAARAVDELRRHWPEAAYGLSTPVISTMLWTAFRETRGRLYWWRLPWPWSQLVFEHVPTFLLPLAALPVLGAALIISGSFTRNSLLRTARFSVVGSMVADGLLTAMAVSPEIFWRRVWLRHDPWILLATVLTSGVLFVTFTLSAWLGCRSPRTDVPAIDRGTSGPIRS